VPETPQEFFDRIAAAAAARPGGRLPVPADITESEIFPFETGDLRVVAFDPPVVPEPARSGDPGGPPCGRCEQGEAGVIWSDERWLLMPIGDTDSLPFSAFLMPREHLDFGELDAPLAAELGPLLVAIERAAKALGDIGRVHLNIWGDGGSHLHVWILARPLGQLQLRGSTLPDWSDVLPPVPAEQRAADQRAVVDALVASYGGRSHLD
jgi:hypothetical protein